MSDTVLNLLLAFFLLAANAFFVAAEFALVKTRGFRMDALAAENRVGAKLTQSILKNVEAYLACCQLGITMASLGLGWVGEPTVAALLEPLLVPLGMPEAALHVTAFVVGFLVFSSLHIVLGEQVPKTLAIREPEPVSLWVAYPLHATFVLLYPLNWVLNAASRSILRLLGVREASHQDILTDVEIEGLVDDVPIPREVVVLMPQGRTAAEVREKLAWLADVGKRTGYRISPRLQIELWGTRRGV
jgi:CBS domain containing-hemolysin-like protein